MTDEIARLIGSLNDESSEIAEDDVDLVALSALWDERWPGCSKLPFELRGIPAGWVRFHTLPGSKRYPETEAEYEIVLARHNAVLSHLATEATVLVVTASYAEAARSPETVAVHPDAVHWTSERIDDEPGFESWIHLHVSQEPWSAGRLDALLRHVADNVIADVMIADPGLRWLYHPYDGGMDVVLPTTTARDALRHHHREWLSKHPSGL